MLMLVKQLAIENIIFLYQYGYCIGTFGDRFEYLSPAKAIIILAGCTCLCWSSLIFDVLSIQTACLLVYGVVCILKKLLWLKILESFFWFQALSRVKNDSCCTLHLVFLQARTYSALAISMLFQVWFPPEITYRKDWNFI